MGFKIDYLHTYIKIILIIHWPVPGSEIVGPAELRKREHNLCMYM